MNKLEVLEVEYISRASRTLETILLKDKSNNNQKVVYVYSYEGVHYRIFDSVIEVSNFFNGEPYSLLKEYLRERYVDIFLKKFRLNS